MISTNIRQDGTLSEVCIFDTNCSVSTDVLKGHNDYVIYIRGTALTGTVFLSKEHTKQIVKELQELLKEE